MSPELCTLSQGVSGARAFLPGCDHIREGSVEGRCVSACPKKLLKLGTKLNFMGVPYAEYAGEGCIGCGACYYSCPEPGAITIYEITED